MSDRIEKGSLDYIQRLEKAISEKYGEDIVANPKNDWDEIKEQEYLDQLKILAEREETQKPIIEIKNGILIEKKLFKNNDHRVCNSCGIYSMKSYDDLYLIKYGLCASCHRKKDFKIESHPTR